jgi:hypothetical protein
MSNVSPLQYIRAMPAAARFSNIGLLGRDASRRKALRLGFRAASGRAVRPLAAGAPMRFVEESARSGCVVQASLGLRAVLPRRCTGLTHRSSGPPSAAAELKR